MRQAGKVGKYLTQRFGPIARLGLQLGALVGMPPMTTPRALAANSKIEGKSNTVAGTRE